MGLSFTAWCSSLPRYSRLNSEEPILLHTGEDQDAFAALLELADQEDPQDSCASQSSAAEKPSGPRDKSKVAAQGPEGSGEPLCIVQPLEVLKKKKHSEIRTHSTPQKPHKKQRSFRGSQENNRNATNVTPQKIALQTKKKTAAAFTSALARDQPAQASNSRANQGTTKVPAAAATLEKFSGLRVSHCTPYAAPFRLH